MDFKMAYLDDGLWAVDTSETYFQDNDLEKIVWLSVTRTNDNISANTDFTEVNGFLDTNRIELR